MALNHNSFPMVEYHKAKRLHWDPQMLDFSSDHTDWEKLNELDRSGLLMLCSQFLVGETAVTHDLTPLLIALRKRGNRLEDEMFLATQLYEEAKHTEFFDRWLSEVPQVTVAAPSILTPSYQALFLERLPMVLNDCLSDSSTLQLALASATYHMIIEGVMAETGYYLFAKTAKARGIFAGLLAGVNKIQQDEARHIAYGLYLIRTLIAEEPTIWPGIMICLSEGLVLATNSLAESFALFGDKIPFDLSPSDALEFASRQFAKRFAMLEQSI